MNLEQSLILTQLQIGKFAAGGINIEKDCPANILFADKKYAGKNSFCHLK